MKTALKIVGGLVLVIIVAATSALVWASSQANATLSMSVETHDVDFPIPYPLSEADVQALNDELMAQGLDADAIAQVDLDSVAQARAMERGQHLVEARYGCADCHGANFGGGEMVDNFMIGSLLAPNITAGAGSRTADFTSADWDRIVRHGVRADGRLAVMPSIDFQRMSDQELADIVTFIQAQPTVDNAVPEPSFGPLGKILMATDQMIPSAAIIADHQSDHLPEPPPAEPTAEFGEHLAATCAGCHSPTLAGGPIAGGDPSWAPAANLTPHADGLAGWTFEQFAAVLVSGIRPDGTQVQLPMTFVLPFGQNMTETELQAIWAYLQTVPAAPTPQ